MLAFGFLMRQLHWATWLRFAIWLAIGLTIYFFYGRKDTPVNRDRPLHDKRVVLPYATANFGVIDRAWG